MIWFAIVSLLLVGIILIVVEMLFVPGTTIVGFIGGGFLFAGVYYSYIKYGQTTGHIVLLATILVSGIVIVGGFRAKTWKKFSNEQQISSKAPNKPFERLFVGKTGIAISSIRPYGTVQFDDDLVEVSSEGEFIDANSNVKIVNIVNEKIFIKRT